MGEWKGGPDTKPYWEDYYMAMAYIVAQRSVDESTVHGACLVSKDHRLLSIGYNGPIRGLSVDPEQLKVRPNKYWHMIHAEENCIINYHGSHSDLVGATMYITGEPCHRCLRMTLQKGIRRIIYGSVGSKCVDAEDRQAKDEMIKCCDSMDIPGGGVVGGVDGEIIETWIHKELEYIQYKEWNGNDKVKELLQKTLNYIDYKENSDG